MAHRTHSHPTVLPDDYARVLLIELKAAAQEGGPLFARYGGYGMEPFLRNGMERICVMPVKSVDEINVYDVLAIEQKSKCVFRRFIRRDGDSIVVAGDSCRNEERVALSAVKGRVSEVRRCDGTTVMCKGVDWTKRSVRAVRKRRIINRVKNIFGDKRRRHWAVAYFVVLLLSMWMPLGGVPLPDNLILGLRPDHLFHASIYCFCAFFLMNLCGISRDALTSKISILLLAGSIATGFATEFGQKLLPYRSFDINDLMANTIGATLGWVVLLMSFILHHHAKRTV